MGIQLAADQVVTERPDGRMGFWDAVKRGMTGRKEFAKANGEFSVGGVNGTIVAMCYTKTSRTR